MLPSPAGACSQTQLNIDGNGIRLNGQSPHLSLTKLSPMNIQFDALSWMCPITGAVSLLSDEPGNNVDLPW